MKPVSKAKAHYQFDGESCHERCACQRRIKSSYFTDFELFRTCPKVYPERTQNQAEASLLEDILINGVRVLFDDTVGKSQVNPIDDRCTFELIQFAHALATF